MRKPLRAMEALARFTLQEAAQQAMCCLFLIMYSRKIMLVLCVSRLVCFFMFLHTVKYNTLFLLINMSDELTLRFYIKSENATLKLKDLILH